MADRVYIETTFVSYLTARPGRDLVFAAHQQISEEWWDTRRTSYELCVSQLVVGEAGAGDPQAAQKRLELLKDMTLLETTPEALALAKELIGAGALPEKAADDALHIAIAATNGVPFLLTWNCRHLANATMRPLIDAVCAAVGLKAPIICTPEELLEAKP
jgi:hypothetical protein